MRRRSRSLGRQVLRLVAENPAVVRQYGPTVARGAVRALGGVAGLAATSLSSLAEQHRAASRALSRSQQARALSYRHSMPLRRAGPAGTFVRRAKSRSRFRRKSKLNALISGTESKLSKLNDISVTTKAISDPSVAGQSIGTVSIYMGPKADADSFIPFENSHYLEGLRYPVGDTINDRNGRYIFLRHTTLKIHIKMQPPTIPSVPERPPVIPIGPVHCRMIVWKVNKNASTLQIDKGRDPSKNFFLDVEANEFGTSQIPNGTETPNIASLATHKFMNALVNKSAYTVIRDKRFKLNYPTTVTNTFTNALIQGPQNTKGTIEKFFTMRLPWNRKVRFNKKIIDPYSNMPDDLDYRYNITFFYSSMPLGTEDAPMALSPDLLRLTAYGVTSAIDN